MNTKLGHGGKWGQDSGISALGIWCWNVEMFRLNYGEKIVTNGLGSEWWLSGAPSGWKITSEKFLVAFKTFSIKDKELLQTERFDGIISQEFL